MPPEHITREIFLVFLLTDLRLGLILIIIP